MKLLIKIFISSILVSVLFQCRSKNTLEREIISTDTFYTRTEDNNCSLFISRNLEISLQEVNNELLTKLLNNKSFNNSGIGYNIRRQKELLFVLVIDNKGKYPLELRDIMIKYNNVKAGTLTSQQLIISNSLSNNSFFGFFKIKSEDLCLKDSDFLQNIKKYDKKIIEPEVKVMKIIAFDRIPVQHRKFTVSLKVKSDIIQKIVDFRFIKFEYRRSGRHFVKPEKNND